MGIKNPVPRAYIWRAATPLSMDSERYLVNIFKVIHPMMAILYDSEGTIQKQRVNEPGQQNRTTDVIPQHSP